MKTIEEIEEAAKVYAESRANPIFRRLELSIAKSAFKAGAEFAQRVVPEKETLNPNNVVQHTAQ